MEGSGEGGGLGGAEGGGIEGGGGDNGRGEGGGSEGRGGDWGGGGEGGSGGGSGGGCGLDGRESHWYIIETCTAGSYRTVKPSAPLSSAGSRPPKKLMYSSLLSPGSASMLTMSRDCTTCCGAGARSAAPAARLLRSARLPSRHSPSCCSSSVRRCDGVHSTCPRTWLDWRAPAGGPGESAAGSGAVSFDALDFPAGGRGRSSR